MAARTGKVARIRTTSAAVSTSTNQAADLSTDGLVVSINSTALRHWDNGSTLPRLYDHAVSTSVPVAAGLINGINYVQGTVTFSTPHSTAATYVLDVASVTASYLPDSHGWAVDIDVNSLDNTAFSTTVTDVTWRTRTPGLVAASVTIDKFLGATTGPTFFDRLNTETDLIVELVTDDAVGRYEGYMWVTGDAADVPIDDLQGESVTLMNNGPLYYTTG